MFLLFFLSVLFSILIWWTCELNIICRHILWFLRDLKIILKCLIVIIFQLFHIFSVSWVWWVFIFGLISFGWRSIDASWLKLIQKLFLFSLALKRKKKVDLKLIWVFILNKDLFTYFMMALYCTRRFISFFCTYGGYFSNIKSTLFILRVLFISLLFYNLLYSHFIVNIFIRFLHKFISIFSGLIIIKIMSISSHEYQPNETLKCIANCLSF